MKKIKKFLDKYYEELYVGGCIVLCIGIGIYIITHAEEDSSRVVIEYV